MQASTSRFLGTGDAACCPMRGKEGRHLSSGVEAIPGALMPGAPAHSREHRRQRLGKLSSGDPHGGPKHPSPRSVTIEQAQGHAN